MSEPVLWVVTIKQSEVQLRQFPHGTELISRIPPTSTMTRDLVVNGIELWGRESSVRTLDRGMEHGHNRPIPILPVEIVFAVATWPVGMDSCRWAHGHRLRLLEDAVRID
jgi:hypothetical protein